MKRVNLRIYAEVMECSEDKIIITELMEVATANPDDFIYKTGMLSFKYHHVAEMFYNGKMVRSLVKSYPETYYFGKFTSVSDFVSENRNRSYHDFLVAINGTGNVTGIVTSLEGIKIIVQENDVVIAPQVEKDKVKLKK